MSTASSIDIASGPGLNAATSRGFMTRLPDSSAEVTTPDRRSLDHAARLMPRDARVYVASLPKDPPDRQIGVCAQVRDLGLIPVPHIVARNIPDRDALDRARDDKIAAARAGDLSIILISQVCFESEPIIRFLRKIRAEGVMERVRVGVAGPAKRRRNSFWISKKRWKRNRR